MNEPSQGCQKYSKFCESGEILPNLVNLWVRERGKVKYDAWLVFLWAKTLCQCDELNASLCLMLRGWVGMEGGFPDWVRQIGENWEMFSCFSLEKRKGIFHFWEVIFEDICRPSRSVVAVDWFLHFVKFGLLAATDASSYHRHHHTHSSS